MGSLLSVKVSSKSFPSSSGLLKRKMEHTRLSLVQSLRESSRPFTAAQPNNGLYFMRLTRDSIITDGFVTLEH